MKTDRKTKEHQQRTREKTVRYLRRHSSSETQGQQGRGAARPQRHPRTQPRVTLRRGEEERQGLPARPAPLHVRLGGLQPLCRRRGVRGVPGITCSGRTAGTCLRLRPGGCRSPGRPDGQGESANGNAKPDEGAQGPRAVPAHAGPHGPGSGCGPKTPAAWGPYPKTPPETARPPPRRLRPRSPGLRARTLRGLVTWQQSWAPGEGARRSVLRTGCGQSRRSVHGARRLPNPDPEPRVCPRVAAGFLSILFLTCPAPNLSQGLSTSGPSEEPRLADPAPSALQPLLPAGRCSSPAPPLPG